MRKEIVGHKPGAAKTLEDVNWLALESMAVAKLTSEDPAFPIENALSFNPEHNEIGWRAAAPGPQTITLNFDHPQRIRRIHLLFIEHQMERSQEFVLRYSSPQQTGREILRQQWAFSPTGSSQEIEDYTVELESVTTLELTIDPDRGLGRSPATLNALRIA
ncbi:MAG TPA: hypothetical protein VMB19_06105 [Silvibacterium sp.]|nr:hypothetical protein [Silvibacterium sp.]